MRRLLLCASIAACAVAAGAAGPNLAHIWTGVYRTYFQNGNVDGEHYRSQDTLEIVDLGQRRAYVSTHLEFFNGHSCSFVGVMGVEGEALVYREGPSSPQPGCVLTIARQGEALVLHDVGNQCLIYYCGARGMLEGASFPQAAKRPITYMARLREDPDFKAALRGAGRKP